jgi:hypothetical protein
MRKRPDSIEDVFAVIAVVGIIALCLFVILAPAYGG